MLILNRDVSIYKPSLGYTITAPAGAKVVKVAIARGRNIITHGYALETPQLYGTSKHDAEHYWFWVDDGVVVEWKDWPASPRRVLLGPYHLPKA